MEKVKNIDIINEEEKIPMKIKKIKIIIKKKHIIIMVH